MSARKDLTRWNRAGLARFRYVDGKAAEYLEILREQLHEKFGDERSGRCEWLSPPERIPLNEVKPDSEALIQRLERLSRRNKRVLETYHQHRRDWAWEITRTFARSCHILTEHANAYTNEAYLGTATQWEHVRRLVGMLDYQPSPPASAFTPLVFVAKDNKSGIVPKGFQVKYTPPEGGKKVVFETLEDLFVDSTLNELRPKGWDELGPLLPSEDGGGEDHAGERRELSEVANGPAVNIAGVGTFAAEKLDKLVDGRSFLIRDFADLDPEQVDIAIAPAWLREWKTKAEILINFNPPDDWSEIALLKLPGILAAAPEELAETSGNSIAASDALQKSIATIEACLDEHIFEVTLLSQLLPPAADIAILAQVESIASPWRAPSKPKIEAGDIAMIRRESRSVVDAEAATVDLVDENDKLIHLRLDQADYSWPAWPRNEVRLHVAPRATHQSWLNGKNVVRTTAPHGLSADTYVCWQVPQTGWSYAKVVEADRRNLRLQTAGLLPAAGSEIFIAQALETDTIAVELEEIALLKEVGDVLAPAVKLVSMDLPGPPPVPPGTPDPIFWLKEPPSTYETGGGLFPPAALPKIGSFLFPSPMLPMDLVKAAVEMLLNLGVMQIPSTEEFVFKGLPLSLPEADDVLPTDTDLTKAAKTLFSLLDSLEAEVDPPGKLVAWDPSLPDKTARLAALEGMLERAIERADGEPTALFKKVEEDMTAEGTGPLLAVTADREVKAVVQPSDPPYMFDGSTKIETGQWVAGRFSDGDKNWLRGLKVGAVSNDSDEKDTEMFSLSFDNLAELEELNTVYADFRGELTPDPSAPNSAPVDSHEIELETLPDGLKEGQSIALSAEGKDPVAATIESIVGSTIRIKPPSPGFTKGRLRIHANVVLAGHGERKPEKILGSGNAAESNQEFLFEVFDVSFTPDPTMRAGVAAAIEVDVEGKVWKQVSSLKDSTPGDDHYVTRMTEEGQLRIVFGDGRHGRRLPTGRNNVRVRYRVGSGLAGNVPARSLEKPVNPHPSVESVYQLFPAAGGGDMEDGKSLRENAPATLLTLQRAVSVSDFAYLAASQSSIWQATAYDEVLNGGRAAQVTVVIVPADGVSSAEVIDATKSFLQKHALPGVQVSVEDFAPERINMSVTVRVRTEEFIARDVERAVVTAVVSEFGLKNRKLGQNLYLSELYKVVEAVRGVENSICVLNNDEARQVIEARDERTIVHLDIDKGSVLGVAAEEYRP